MLIVPTLAHPNQTLTVSLASQPVRLNIYQNPYGVFMDVLVNDAAIVTGVICHNANPIVRSAYLGFTGDFAWLDTQGRDDPDYTGMGLRWVLAYLEVGDTIDFTYPGLANTRGIIEFVGSNGGIVSFAGSSGELIVFVGGL
jgi:hypothetical protein